MIAMVNLASIRSIDVFSAERVAQAVAGDTTGALEQISDFVATIDLEDPTVGHILSSAQLDTACLAIGALKLPPINAPTDPDLAVYIVTALYRSGGHTRVLRDLIAADPATRAIILLTGLATGLTVSEIEAFLGELPATVEVAPGVDYASRLYWLQGRLAALRPGRTYLLQHQHDPVAIAACQPDLTGTLFYFHHADHNLALGVHLPHAIHIDFQATSVYGCREREGVTRTDFWPLVVPDPHPPRDRIFMRQGTLTTCSSGGGEKFEAAHRANLIPYLYRYAEILPLILKATGGTHIHIGGLSPSLRQAIDTALAKADIAPERFRHLEFVPSLAAAFLEHEVDLYITSFPIAGGRTLIEVMAAGLPLVVHSNYRSVFFTEQCETYPGAFIWRTPAELIARLQSLTPADLQQQSRASRQLYEDYHRPECLAAAIAHTLAGQENPLPPRPVYYPDLLQDYLDEQQAGANAFVARDRVLAELAVAKKALGEKTAEAERWRRELAAVYNSASWKFAKPVRALGWLRRKLRLFPFKGKTRR
jgi:hypothetical protein